MPIDRRDFIKIAGTTTAAAGGGLLTLPVLGGPQPQPTFTRLIPADKGVTPEMLGALKQRGQRRVYRGRSRLAIGMPVGGICAGQLYILGDGTLGEWHVDGRLNSTGYGSENYKARPPERQLQQGFALRAADAAGGTWQTVLADPENGGHYDAVEFIGEYPVAEIRYAGGRSADRQGGAGAERPNPPSTSPPPLAITLRAYSPFCPTSAKDSALPCTVLRFTLTSRHGKPIAGMLSGWLENGVERVDSSDDGPVARRNRVQRAGDLTAVLMDAVPTPVPENPRPDRVIAGFEGDAYMGWTAEGTAFGKGPSRGTEADQNPVSGFTGKGLVNSFRGGEGTAAGDKHTGKLTSDEFTIDRAFLVFLIGGGNHKGSTCMNLLVEGKVIRTATGRAEEKLGPRLWDLRDLQGKTARLQIIDSATGPWGHINVDDIRLVDTLPADLRRPRPDSLSSGTMCLAFLGKAGAGADRQGPARTGTGASTPPDGPDLAQGESSATPVGVIHAPFNLKPGESAELVFLVAWHFPNLHTGQGQMYTNWFDSALAAAQYVAANDKRLWDQTELFRKTFYEDTTLPWWLALRLMMPTANLATGTAQWWKNGRFWGWEGVGCCHGTCTHVWNYSHAEARLFPELARSARVMQDFGTGFEEATGRVAFRGEVSNGFEYAADGQSGTILKSYREHLCSPDDSFLRANWPRIKKAMEYQVAKDAQVRKAGGESEPDGIIETTQHNTFDINFEGPNTFVGSLYLAALLAAAEMAGCMGEADTARRYRDLARRGREFTEKTLFNGEYFVQKIPEDAAQANFQYGDGCLTDQLFGQTWARLLGLPAIYDEEKARTALRSIYRYNWAPAVGPYNEKFPPERYFVRDRDGGLFVCTWPRGGRIAPPNEPVRYRDEVWTGCEYQTAAGMVAEGLLDEGLVIVKAVDERYDGTLHNPWNEVECGDHYARAMASWGVFQALCGFHYDGPAGLLALAPRVSPENFAAFFAGALGWGLLRQTRSGRTQTSTIELRWGTLDLSAVGTDLPEGVANARASAALGREQLPAPTVKLNAPRAAAILARPVSLAAGQSLTVAWSW